MKHLYLLLSLFLPLNFVIAQSITVGNISKNTMCVRDTIWVSYSSSGSFKADNFFAAQLSDGNGSFTAFTNIGHKTATTDSFAIFIGGIGDRWRVRVISTDPYSVSDTSSSIQTFDYPFPIPVTDLRITASFGAIGFLGETIKLWDAQSELTGSKYFWSFDQDANTVWTTVDSPSVTYASEGVKTGSLTVSDSIGCSTTEKFKLMIVSCMPVIPDSVYISTGTETGYHPYVWAKAGSNYTTSSTYNFTTAFIEPGASLRTSKSNRGIYYVKQGGSFSPSADQTYAVVFLNHGTYINYGSDGANDTLYCDNLQFDYSQVAGADVQVAENPLQILNTPNHLQVSCNGAAISASIVNLFGTTILSKIDRDILSLDLSALTNGVYFAIITSGDHREVRKIAVVH